MTVLKELLFPKVGDCGLYSNNKVSVVGAGQVGMACSLSILTQVSYYRDRDQHNFCQQRVSLLILLIQNVSSDLALVDEDARKLKGELMDLHHGSAFMNNAKIQGSTGN